MLGNEFQMDAAGLQEWFQNGEKFIVDCGYRDVLPLLKNLGIHHKILTLVEPGQRQLNTQAANDSRIITKIRWLVEARNDHIKSVFHFFEGTFSMNHAINIRDSCRITGAILNKYREPIVTEGETAAIAERMLEKFRAPNVIQARVEMDNLHVRNARLAQLNENHVPYFSRLDFNYLMDLTMGIHQLKLKPTYIHRRTIG